MRKQTESKEEKNTRSLEEDKDCERRVGEINQFVLMVTPPDEGRFAAHASRFFKNGECGLEHSVFYQGHVRFVLS